MPQDDSFQLFDLRVEVVCPPEKRILCGAKAGDYFTLKGEMMHLPPNQGISIYSLANGSTASPSSGATHHSCERLDDH
ncbi:hypothetical protein EYB25_002645 [Talaromyces marneffei]|nr:hypothetical protein EYB25_002645 [Talaromyces marneffei]